MGSFQAAIASGAAVPVNLRGPRRRWPIAQQIGPNIPSPMMSRLAQFRRCIAQVGDKANLVFKSQSIRNTLRCAASTSINCGRCLKVVELGSFSAAARQLNLTQPAVSLQIRELERRFGVQLIERVGKRAHATAPGRDLVEAAAAHLPRVRAHRRGDAPIPRRLDRPRAYRHHQHDADVRAAADPARAASRASRHRPARHQHADPRERRAHSPEQDRPRAGDAARGGAATARSRRCARRCSSPSSRRTRRAYPTRSRPSTSRGSRC